MTATLNENMRAICTELKAMFHERDDMTEVFVLALLSGQHAFALGEPGTGKSMLARELASRVTNARYFEALLSRTRPAEAVLGPLDLSKLQQGVFVRKSEGFLPTADLAFIDELGNMSPTLAHDLLAIFNERILHEVDENGRSARKVPLSTVFGAGNQTPVDESDDARALWDRMLLRCKVDYIRTNRNFAKLFKTPKASKPTTVEWSALKNAVENEIPNIEIPDSVLALIIQLKEKLSKLDVPIILSDRRWKEAAKVMRAHAWLNGRTECNASDLLVFRYIAWTNEDEIKHAERTVLSIADKVTEGIKNLMDDLGKLHKTITERKGKGADERGSHARSTFKKLKPTYQEILKLKIENPTHKDIPALEALYIRIWTDIFKLLMDQEDGIPEVSF